MCLAVVVGLWQCQLLDVSICTGCSGSPLHFVLLVWRCAIILVLLKLVLLLLIVGGFVVRIRSRLKLGL